MTMLLTTTQRMEFGTCGVRTQTRDEVVSNVALDAHPAEVATQHWMNPFAFISDRTHDLV